MVDNRHSGMSLFSFPANYRAVVIGGSGGVGSAIASLFFDLGARVTATGVDKQAIGNSPLNRRDGLEFSELDVTNDEANASRSALLLSAGDSRAKLPAPSLSCACRPLNTQQARWSR